MIYELFTLTGILAWSYVILVGLFITGAVVKEAPGWALFWLALAIALVICFTSFRPNFTGTELLVYTLSYVALGVVYGAYRWVRFVRKVRAAYDALPPPADLAADERRIELGRRFGSSKYQMSVPPKTSEFRSKTRTWIWFWPFSVSVWLFEDVLSNFANFVVKTVGKGYDALTRYAW